MSKPFAKLKRADFAAAPIWEWAPEQDAQDAQDAATDDQDTDESFVLATNFAEVPLLPFAQFIVASVVDLKNGSSLPGIAEVTVSEGTVVVQANFVFLLDRQLQIPGVETNRLLTRFTKTAENYPVAWRLGVNIQGEGQPRAGRINGGDITDMVRAGIDALLALRKLRD